MASLLKSRKFWITVFDVVVSTATYMISRYMSPEVAEDILWLIAAWQPVIISLILGIAAEDAAEKGQQAYFIEIEEEE
jgi:hypothetical protein